MQNNEQNGTYNPAYEDLTDHEVMWLNNFMKRWDRAVDTEGKPVDSEREKILKLARATFTKPERAELVCNIIRGVA